jgi:ubiquinol-cytochrome c reductase cytochrome b subunit
MSIMHLTLLHHSASGNPLGIQSNLDKVPMYPYFILKDFFSIMGLVLVFSLFVFFFPNSMGHPDNYIEANAMVTPTHIVPE